MAPDVFQLNGHALEDKEFRFNNALVEQLGVEAIIDAASHQPAGRLVLHNTPTYVQPAERASIAFARQFRLAPFNAYRRRWQLPSYSSISELTGGDRALASQLNALYGDDVERVELPVGLLAEARSPDQVLPPLLQRMVASDAFSQALTNPLLAAHVYGSVCFWEFGLKEIENTHGFADIIRLNTTKGVPQPLATFTAPASAGG